MRRVLQRPQHVRRRSLWRMDDSGLDDVGCRPRKGSVTGANPANHAGLRLRVDPWAPEYDASLQLVEDDDEAAPVDITVERPVWGAVAPAPGVTPPLSIVDGVRRVELRVVSEVDGRICYGLFGSAAVGAARLDVRAEITDVRVERFLVMGGGLAPGDRTIPASAAPLEFQGIAVADNSSMAPLAGLQEQMRAAEAICSEQLARRPGEVIIVDGPLPPLRPPTAVIVGYVKRMQRGYLGPPEAALLAQLGPGERTPVFAILNDGRHRARYSWYVRLAPAAPFAHAFAGVARLEVSETIGIADAVRIADLTARALPRLASTSDRDLRAPQNLVPVGALEQHLRHRLGDPAWIRRLLLTSLAEAAS
jgi:hypothetical protein